MLISKICIYQSPIKLKEPFIISLGSFEYASNIIVKIVTSSGLIGFGECSPFASINGEVMESCYVIARLLARALIAKNPLEIENCINTMDEVIYGNNSIKSAFDIALYDIASQEANMPLYGFLSGFNNKKLLTDYTISFAQPMKMVADALIIKDQGFKAIKVKLGGSANDDINRIKLIRQAIGNEIPLRLDANQGWDVKNALIILNALQDEHIEFCEEPIARWNFMELKTVRENSPIKIMADECCSNHHDAKRLIDLHSCDYFNVKLGKSGGIFNAVKILKLAENANMKVQIGGFLESRLAFTAAAHLALSSPTVAFCDFDTPLMFEEDPVLNGINYFNGGEIRMPNEIGLGASFSEHYLQKLTQFEVN